MTVEAASFVTGLTSSLPGATDSIVEGDDHIRLLKTVLKATLPTGSRALYVDGTKVSVAADTTTDILAAASDYVHITGNGATITSLGTGTARRKFVVIEDVNTLTHNATSLILPGGANITTAAGDCMLVQSDASSNARVLAYFRASGLPPVVSFDPAADDGDSLGTTALKWSDLFLASGAVINFDNGNLTITHAAGQLTISGTIISSGINLADNALTRATLLDYGITVNAIGSIGGGSQEIDLTLGNAVTATVDTATTTLTFTNPPASGVFGEFILILTNPGSQTLNLPASVKWEGGVAPTWTASGVDIVHFFTVDGGTTWYATVVGLAFASP